MSLAVAYAPLPYRHRMPTRSRDVSTPRAQLEAMGKAVREMRKLAGPLGAKITTSEAARRAGLSRQTWENYENARSQIILRQDVQDQIAAALGVTRDDLLLEQRRHLGDTTPGEGRGMEEPSRVFPFPINGAAKQLLMPDDTLRPWASSGMTIVYDRNLWPAPEHGVVLEGADGQQLVKIFGHSDADNFHVFELYPDRKPLAFPRSQFKAYRVIARVG